MRSYRRRIIDDDLFRNRGLFKGQVLDLGGGRTRGRFPHGRELGWVVADIDMKLTPTVVADAHKLSFKDGIFDAVKSSDLAGYLYEPIKMVEEVKRVLKPGGAAVITAPLLTAYDDDQHDSVRLTSAWWGWAAKEAGLRVIKIKPQGYLFTVIADMERYWISRWWLPFRYFAYLVMFPVYEAMFWWERKIGVPQYLKRFTTGFLIILRK